MRSGRSENLLWVIGLCAPYCKAISRYAQACNHIEVMGSRTSIFIPYILASCVIVSVSVCIIYCIYCIYMSYYVNVFHTIVQFRVHYAKDFSSCTNSITVEQLWCPNREVREVVSGSALNSADTDITKHSNYCHLQGMSKERRGHRLTSHEGLSVRVLCHGFTCYTLQSQVSSPGGR